eukprot:scaffold9232_cov110-Cylindrotheca_fusiformis.AAC.3
MVCRRRHRDGVGPPAVVCAAAGWRYRQSFRSRHRRQVATRSSPWARLEGRQLAAVPPRPMGWRRPALECLPGATTLDRIRL